MMAAGLVTIAHNTGGPKSDIVVPHGDKKQITGFLASSVDEYADAMYKALKNGPNCEENLSIRIVARDTAQRFSDNIFNESFKSIICPHLIKV